MKVHLRELKVIREYSLKLKRTVTTIGCFVGQALDRQKGYEYDIQNEKMYTISLDEAIYKPEKLANCFELLAEKIREDFK